MILIPQTNYMVIRGITVFLLYVIVNIRLKVLYSSFYLKYSVKSTCTSPSEWFICDDDQSGRRFFVIQIGKLGLYMIAASFSKLLHAHNVIEDWCISEFWTTI